MPNIFRENKHIFIVVAAVLILLIFLHSFKILSPIEKVITGALKPIQTTLSSGSNTFKNFFGKFSDFNNLSDENEELKKQIQQLTIENSATKTLIEENKIIDPQIKKLQEKNYNYILSRVISKGVDPTFKTMMINQGSDQGISVGMPVVADEMILIGKIIEVESNRSQVMLLNDTRSSTASQIQNEDVTMGLISGEFGLSLKMELILKEDKFDIDQTVITSGLENTIPKGLLIGRIESIKVQPGEFFQTAYIYPLSDYEKIQIVSVITSF